MPATSDGPFFLVDFGHGLGSPEFPALVRATNIVGAILKVSQGTSSQWPSWFNKQWRRARDAGGGRYGSTWFRGAYHFATPADGARQADFALDAIEAAGGWDDGDMPLAWDIEGDAWNDDKALRRRVSSKFAARVLQRTGRRPMLYGNGDIGIGADDGFDTMWTPHPRRLAPWPAARFRIYQYAGLNNGTVSYYDPRGIPARKGFPLRVPGWGSSHGTDMNVVLNGGNALTDVRKLRSVLTGKNGSRAGIVTGLVTLAIAFFGSR